MEIEKIINADTLTIKLSGNLDSSTSTDFENQIKDDLINISSLILDFKQVGYISSKGIRVILQLNKIMKQQGSMKIINCNPAVIEVFTISGLTKILNL
ncbi:MAG: STAS domain-containing protein [Bacteroidales bacterium]|nr:STAS domain-containing protein [Bacteroidales bacterium]